MTLIVVVPHVILCRFITILSKRISSPHQINIVFDVSRSPLISIRSGPANGKFEEPESGNGEEECGEPVVS